MGWGEVFGFGFSHGLRDRLLLFAVVIRTKRATRHRAVVLVIVFILCFVVGWFLVCGCYYLRLFPGKQASLSSSTPGAVPPSQVWEWRGSERLIVSE